MTHPASLVSVIMIFRNAEAFFDEAIRSVLAQTHPVELLLCDDGSSDSSTGIAKSWVDREPDRVHYLAHPGGQHRGMSATRNLGIRAARGDYVAFLDADDIWRPEHLTAEVALLERTPEADLVCGQALEWHSWRDTATADRWTPLPWPPGTVVPAPRMLTATLRRGAYRTPTCSLLVRRSLLERAGGADDAFTGMFEDQALLAKLHLAGSSVISGSRTALYRRHPGSCTSLSRRNGIFDPILANPSQETFLRWLDSRLTSDTRLGDEELREAMGRALGRYSARTTDLGRRRLRPVGRWRRRVLMAMSSRQRGLMRLRAGALRRVAPLSREFGYDRGLPVDRYFVENFLDENAPGIEGRVLEVGDAAYTRRFGGSRVATADVLNINAGHPETTYIADLSDGTSLPSATFDCIILTQTLHLLYDLGGAVRTLRRILRPGGVVLATFPGITPLSTDEWAGTWYWALTPLSAERLFGDVFGQENVEVAAWGNVLTSTAFLYGMATEDLRIEELLEVDPQFPMLVTTRAYVRPR